MDFTGYIGGLKELAAIANKREEGDYEKDGLLFCGKCHTPKQAMVMLLGVYDKVSIQCDCSKKRRDAEREAWEREKRAEYVKRLRAEAFPDSRMGTWTFEQDDGANPISQAMKQYAENFDVIKKNPVNGLILYGATGTGKSFLAACIANRIIDRGIPVLMTSFDRIRNELDQRKGARQDYFDYLAHIPLLVLDDLAAESSVGYMKEIVFGVINARAQSGLPLIITTNMTSAELKKPANEESNRVFSRILGMCQPIEIKGDDRRHDALRNGSRALMDIIGL